MLLLSVVFSGCNTVTYKDDPEDYIQTTRETAELGTGDCEDMALVRYWRAIDQGKDAKLLHLTRKSNPFNKASHVLTVIDGSWYDNRGRIRRDQYSEYQNKWTIYREITHLQVFEYGQPIEMPREWKSYFRRELIQRLPGNELTPERMAIYN